jgi:hypothetical protein
VVFVVFSELDELRYKLFLPWYFPPLGGRGVESDDEDDYAEMEDLRMRQEQRGDLGGSEERG